MFYVAIDGDDIGRLLTQKIYNSTDEFNVIKFSKMVTDSFEKVAIWVRQNQGEVLFCTGDSILFKIPENLIEEAALFQHVSKYFNVSVGVGNNLKEAHWALNIAKSLGKARTVYFDEIRKEIFGQN